MAIGAGLFLISVATLAFEITLTRVFSVAQFYHFAFMIVSLALLGFGASGTFLTLCPQLRRIAPGRLLALLAVGFTLSVVGSYALTLYVPFDFFRIVHDWRQAAVLALHYLALALPFFCSGLAVAALFAADPGRIHRTYAANLSGSALGCLLAVSAPVWVGGEGVILLAAALGLLAAAICGWQGMRATREARRVGWTAEQVALWLGIAVLGTAVFRPPAWLEIRLSPYKSLSYALLVPEFKSEFPALERLLARGRRQLAQHS